MQVQRATLGLAVLLTAAGCSKSEEPVGSAAEEESKTAAAPESQPAAAAPTTPEPPPIPQGAKISFVEPTAGKLEGPERAGKIVVPVKMGAEGIVVEPAGEQKPGSGHHHILIDHEPLSRGTVVPKDETHLHFGKGQTETELELTPGTHTLTLQFADGLHLSYGPELSTQIEVEVVSNGEQAPAPAE